MKTFLIFILLTTNLFGHESLEELFGKAVNDYNYRRYSVSKDKIEKLINHDYHDPYIYFVLGKIYREDDIYSHNKSIYYFNKYLKKTDKEKIIHRTNRMYVTINMAYEYLKIWNPENINKAKKVLEKFSQESILRDHYDFKHCYATVYNSSGYYYLQAAKNTEVDADYYVSVINDLRKALFSRPEIVGIANNLAIAYIRAIELLPKKDYKRKQYIKLVNILLNKKKYHISENFIETKKYFEENVK